MILHVDMDAFFASVEQLDCPHLKGRCVLVGGLSDRAVVAACSYAARKFGIHSAMPMYEARRKCPEAVVVPPRMARYKEFSERIMRVLRGFTPMVEPVSIDEAYLDVSGCGKLFGDPQQLALAVKSDLLSAVNLTCSVGVAPVRFLAKIASDRNKPDGLFVIEPDAVDAFIATLPLEKVPGVGPKTHACLKALGIHHLGDVKKLPESTLTARLGKFGIRLMQMARGIDEKGITTERTPKSIGSEETLSENTRDRSLLGRYIRKQSGEIAAQLRRKKMRARVVTLKIKHADFTLMTRRSPLDRPVQSSDPICREALKLLDGYRINRDIRLVGVTASGLVAADRPVQRHLFRDQDAADRNWEKVEHTVDQITRRFGKGTIQRASLSGD